MYLRWHKFIVAIFQDCELLLIYKSRMDLAKLFLMLLKAQTFHRVCLAETDTF